LRLNTSRLAKNTLFGILPIILVIGAARLIGSSLIFSTRAFEHHHQVVDSANVVLSDLLDAETSARGYVITGDDEFLGLYRSALARIDPDTATLRKLLADDPQQHERMSELEPLIAKKLSLLREGIELRRDQGLEAVVQTSKLKRGKTTMDAIRSVVADLKEEENQRASDSLDLSWW
jgi:methyl-accepting chemotaxis protein